MLKQKAVEAVAVDAKMATRCEHTDSLSRQVATALFWAVMGLLSPRVTVYGGLSPFGVGLAASAGDVGALLTYAAVSVGYILSGDTVFLLRYLAAVTVAAGVRWSFAGLKAPAARRLMPPIAAFVAALTAGFAVQIPSGLSAYTVAALVAEGVLAAGFARMCAITDSLLRGYKQDVRGLTPAEQVSVTSVAAVAVTALAAVSVGGVSLGRILAAVAVLIFARSGKEQSGGIAGVALGTALLLTNPESAFAAMGLAFGGLVAGIFARANRFAAAGAYLITSTLLVLASGNGEAMARTAYEAAVAGVLFVLLPTSLDRRINGFFLRGTELPAVEGLRRSLVWRLEYAACAMGEVAGTVDAVSRRMGEISAPDLGSLCRSASEEICHDCAYHLRCWDGGYAETVDSFNHMTNVLRAKGTASKNELSGRLSDCPKADELLGKVNEGYARFLMRESAFRRLNEIRAVAGDQFHAMSEMLTELSETFSNPTVVDEQAATRVREACEQYGLRPQEVMCTTDRGGHMEVNLTVEDADVHFDELAWREQVSDACGRTFARPVIMRFGSTARVTLREKPRWRVTVGQAQLCCSGERLCGDASDVFTDTEGRTVMVLSDGMGCGGRAAVDGAMAAGLTARLLKAGFGSDSVLRMVNAALMVKGGDESLATLDVAIIDPFSGQLVSLKAGASVSLLRSGGRVSRIERSSLPLGILREVSFARSTDTLVGGDILLLFSDGAVSESVAAAEKILAEYDEDAGSMQNLAETVASAARRLQQSSGSHEDDITVLAMRVHA